MMKSAGGAGGMGMSGLALAGAGGGGGHGGSISFDPQTGQSLALPPPTEFEQKIDIARIEGQVSGSSVRKVAEFVEKHPEESIAILRNWCARQLMATPIKKRPSVEDVSRLSGPEKAAVVLLALGEDHQDLWKQLDDEEIKEISQAMAGLGTVGANVVENLLIEFVSGLSSTGAIMGSFEGTQRLLSSILPPDKVDQLMEEIRGPAGRTMWDKLGNVNEGVLANYLKNEYPQTVAVVLSKIKGDHASRVLSALPEDFALECVQRMLRMEPVQREILDKIEQTLRTEFMSNLARTSKRDSHEMMADIFNNFDRQTEARFIAALEERNRESAERIRALMFVFEDLSKLDPGGVQDLATWGWRSPSWAWL